ncbi:MAG: hypothetical protein SGJ23_04095 [Alphaproteobacteria bacterium]|nr:hypothetical protein [Alphaproteobacteria bacterium]
MNGVTLIVAAIAIFLAAVAGILASTIYMFRFAGMATNARRPIAQRRMRGALAIACLLGIFASATAGYLGIITLMYHGARAAHPAAA